MYGLFFEHFDLKQNQIKQLSRFFDFVLKLKKGKRNKQINGILFVFVCWFFKPETEKLK